MDKNSGKIPQEQEVPVAHEAPSPQFPCLVDKSPPLLAAKKLAGIESMEGTV